MKFIELKANDRGKINKIIKIEEEVFGENGGVDEWILKPFIRYGKVYAAENSEGVIGVIELMKNWSGDTVYIYGLAVEKIHQNKGVGTFLLKNIKRICLKEKIKKLTLTVSEKNKVAIMLYKKIGFKNEKKLKDEYGEGIDRIYMEYEFK